MLEAAEFIAGHDHVPRPVQYHTGRNIIEASNVTVSPQTGAISSILYRRIVEPSADSIGSASRKEITCAIHSQKGGVVRSVRRTFVTVGPYRRAERVAFDNYRRGAGVIGGERKIRISGGIHRQANWATLILIETIRPHRPATGRVLDHYN